MPLTYDSIATTTTSTNPTDIVFSSIPQTYTDLRLVLSGRFNADSFIRIRMNGVTGNNYSYTVVWAETGSVQTTRQTGGTNILFPQHNLVGGTEPSTATIDFLNYRTTINKSLILQTANYRSSSPTHETGVAAFQTSSAISSITIYSSNTTFANGYTASLYGILRA